MPFALLLAWPSMLPFTVGALGCAALLGLGNGAVFKLVPQYFPADTGTVTGLVGAMGGLGGFFPPLLLGFFRDRLGAIWPGFVLLALTSLALWRLNAPRLPAAAGGGGAGPAARADAAPPSGCAPAPGRPCGPALLVAAIVVGLAQPPELRRRRW